MADRRVRSSGRPTYGRAQPLTPPRKRRTPRVSVGQIPRRFMVLIVVVILALYGLNQSFAINHVSVRSVARTADIQASAMNLLKHNLLQQSLLTINDGALENDLMKADPMIKTVTVRRSWPHGLVVTATLKEPAIGWASGDQVYLIDKDGTAIGIMPAGATYPVIYDGSNLPVAIGQRVMTSHLAGYMQALPAALTAAGVTPTRYEVKDTTLDLYVTTNKGYKLILDTSRPIEDTTANLKAVLASLAAQKRTPAQYIDLRVPDKAYYQ